MRKSRDSVSYRHMPELSTTVELRICVGRPPGRRQGQQMKKGNFANEPQSLGAWTTQLFPNILAQRHFSSSKNDFFFLFGARKFCV